jgi:hypothetical protein
MDTSKWLAELPNSNNRREFSHDSDVIVIERAICKILWKLGAPPWSGQHSPIAHRYSNEDLATVTATVALLKNMSLKTARRLLHIMSP